MISANQNNSKKKDSFYNQVIRNTPVQVMEGQSLNPFSHKAE